ncbi:kinase-like protein [Exidia glandulosa HHB12029]|uniref:Kinase-like protein n=1 Tax=Exidia glandulosa HHB12029 TaxID=1314781 RepID=A0A165MX39_EXIGL|nr:kinase-like protein [Exidia glandulosa HHB12029]
MCGFYEGYGSAPALVSPWYENGDINSYVRRHAADPNVDMLKFRLLELCVWLTYIIVHDHCIIHGDIKGGNVLISDDNVARLCDFGLSRLLLEHSQSITHTGVKGTSRWMAPELLLVDGAQHSYATDIWASGCLLIEVRPYYSRSFATTTKRRSYVTGMERRVAIPHEGKQSSSHISALTRGATFPPRQHA